LGGERWDGKEEEGETEEESVGRSVGIYRPCRRRIEAVGIYRQILRRNYVRR
jgi:hypothetical protein